MKMLTGYCQEKQRKIFKKARKQYRNLTEEEKNKKVKKSQYARERYRNLSEEEKNKNMGLKDIEIFLKMKNKY